jgi:hypothetical protein
LLLGRWVEAAVVDGSVQWVAHAQLANPSASRSGADGVPITAPDASTSCSSSLAARWAELPFTVALSKGVTLRLGSDACDAPLEPIVSGVSSIHSAVALEDA